MSGMTCTIKVTNSSEMRQSLKSIQKPTISYASSPKKESALKSGFVTQAGSAVFTPAENDDPWAKLMDVMFSPKQNADFVSKNKQLVQQWALEKS